MIGYVFSVGGFAIAATLATLWLLARPADRRRVWLLAAVIIFYTLASVRAVSWILSRPLVAPYHQFTKGEAADGTPIVLLGSASFTVHGHERQGGIGVLDLAGAARVLEAARVHRLLGGSTIFSSGGAADGVDTEPAAVTMRTALVQLGVAPAKIVLESLSENTHDEAVLLAPMLREAGVRRCVLVTSDMHMLRAVATFRAAGLNPIPAITPDPLHSESPVRSFIPTTNGLSFASAVAHEYIGLAYYAARGWIRF